MARFHIDGIEYTLTRRADGRFRVQCTDDAWDYETCEHARCLTWDVQGCHSVDDALDVLGVQCC